MHSNLLHRSPPCCSRRSFLLPRSRLRAQTVVVPDQPPTTQLPGDPAVAPGAVVPVQPAPGRGRPRSPARLWSRPARPVAGPVSARGGSRAGRAHRRNPADVARGSVQAYFGRAPRRERMGLGNVELSVKLPSTATVTKLASRDKESEGARRITPDNPWNVRVRFSGPGRYVFNMVEWDNDPVVTSVRGPGGRPNRFCRPRQRGQHQRLGAKDLWPRRREERQPRDRVCPRLAGNRIVLGSESVGRRMFPLFKKANQSRSPGSCRGTRLKRGFRDAPLGEDNPCKPARSVRGSRCPTRNYPAATRRNIPPTARRPRWPGAPRANAPRRKSTRSGSWQRPSGSR